MIANRKEAWFASFFQYSCWRHSQSGAWKERRQSVIEGKARAYPPSQFSGACEQQHSWPKIVKCVKNLQDTYTLILRIHILSCYVLLDMEGWEMCLRSFHAYQVPTKNALRKWILYVFNPCLPPLHYLCLKSFWARIWKNSMKFNSLPNA